MSASRVFHKENGGLSDARNMGLMEAHGEFLAFVDSDDLLAPKAVETLETLCETSNAEAAIGQVSAFAGHCTFAEESAQGEVIPMKEAMRRMLLHSEDRPRMRGASCIGVPSADDEIPGWTAL